MSSSRRGVLLGRNAEITEMVQTLVKKNNQLERMLGKIGTSADTAEFRDLLARVRAECHDLCKRLFDSVKTATSSQFSFQNSYQDQGSQDVLKKLSRQFEEQLKKYKELNEQIEHREQQIMTAMSASVQDSSALHREDRGSIGDYGYQQQQEQEQDDVQFQQADLQDIKRKAEGIRQLERDVMELSEMFVDLHELVVQQQDSLDSIEDNITSAHTETVAASEELIKAEEYQKSARKRQCCILFLVLAIITAIVLAGVFIFKK
jgi:syntaxin 7